jgi:hypothetical protein
MGGRTWNWVIIERLFCDVDPEDGGVVEVLVL